MLMLFAGVAIGLALRPFVRTVLDMRRESETPEQERKRMLAWLKAMEPKKEPEVPVNIMKSDV